jgi:ubiquitin-conjugating enzyme E2 J2
MRREQAGTVILGLLSFMMEEEVTAGSIKTTKEEKERCAAASWAFNAKDPTLLELFPEHLRQSP